MSSTNCSIGQYVKCHSTKWVTFGLEDSLSNVIVSNDNSPIRQLAECQCAKWHFSYKTVCQMSFYKVTIVLWGSMSNVILPNDIWFIRQYVKCHFVNWPLPFFSDLSPTLKPRNPHWRGSLSTVDLLALTSFNQVIFIFTFDTKQTTLIRKLTVLSLPLQSESLQY